MPKVLLINEGEKEFKDKWNGKEIIIPVGKAAKIEDYVAYHFIGDPELLNGDNANKAAAERKLINFRYGAFKPEQVAGRVPNLRIEPIEEEAEVQIVDTKKNPGKKAEDEKEFPDLAPNNLAKNWGNTKDLKK
jgi:hypothetical protein